MHLLNWDPSIPEFLKNLRDQMIIAFESFEQNAQFQRRTWSRALGGGGEISLLRGQVFEKAAVNWSAVWGDEFPLPEAQGSFYATGISVITHMFNPWAPTVHMNLRYLVTEQKQWFGGGFDLTPMGFPLDEDTLHFHSVAQKILDQQGKHFYPLFSKQAAEYFYIPHYQAERGVGGIFFDHYCTDDFQKDLKLWKSVGEGFLESILPIYQKRVKLPYTAAQREIQLKSRARYVEFNLLYDRGTRFGFASGGSPEAILSSLPPCVCW